MPFIPDQRPKSRFVPDAPRQFVGPPDIRTRRDLLTSPQALKDAAIGVGDVAVSSARSMVNAPVSSLAGLAGAIMPDDTYLGAQQRAREQIATDQGLVRDDRLRTPQGEMVAGGLNRALEATYIPQATRALGNIVEQFAGPEVRDFAGSVLNVAAFGAPRLLSQTARRTSLNAPNAAPEPVGRGGLASNDSVGASAAAISLEGASPELRAAVQAAERRGVPLNREAIQRYIEAESLPVPIALTTGEATQDIVALSNERNLRGNRPQLAYRMAETNKRLGENLQSLRDRVGEDVFTTNMVEHGDTLLAAYRKIDEARNANIRALYKRLEDEFGGRVPVDANAILRDATENLHKKLKYEFAPAVEMSQLKAFAAAKNMTFEQFESLRSNLAATIRSSSNGNEKAAARIMLQALEDVPLFPGSGVERLKPIADAARRAARERFAELEADPAYSAAVESSISADKFVQKFVLGAARDDVSRLMSAVESVPGARQTVAVAVLDYLRDAARLDPNYSGNFSAAGFAKALRQLDPKAGLIFDADTAETLGRLRNVATYSTAQPRGSYINNSNTFVSAATKVGASAAEGAANYAAHGIPVGTFAKRLFEERALRREVGNALAPGKGVSMSPPKTTKLKPRSIYSDPPSNSLK
jgi:hypothetical protein